MPLCPPSYLAEKFSPRTVPQATAVDSILILQSIPAVPFRPAHLCLEFGVAVLPVRNAVDLWQ